MHHGTPSHSSLNVDASLCSPPSYRVSIPIPHASTPSTPSPNTRRTSLLPLHQSRSAPVEHVYSLLDSRNAPWATLKLLSNVASPRFLPAYFEGQSIHGTLELNLRKPKTILGITVTISGTIMAANAPDPRVFWELTRVLWNAEMGDPRSSSQNQNQSSTSEHTKGKGKNCSKLVGAYYWSFAISLPSTCTVTLRSNQTPVILPLPPSFSEKGASQFINYEITVRIRRGPLRIDSKLGTHFGFAPRTRPPSPSLLRQLAYQENTSLVGPEGDTDGWTVLPPIIIRGKLFGVRIVEAVCTFALALPLTYSRGHPVPLMLTVNCADAQALDLVFVPQNVSVHLIREVCYDAGCPDSARKRWGSGLESSPADSSLAVTAATPSHFNRKAFLPRAVPQSQSDGTITSPASASGGSASAGAGTDDASDASLARAGQIQKQRPSLYSHSSASISVSAAMSSLLSRTSSTLSLSTAKSEKTRKKSKTKEKEKMPKIAPKLALHGARKPITSAVWWPRQSGGDSAVDTAMAALKTRTRRWSSIRTRERRMEGEILLPKDLVPSFEFGGFSVKYALALLPFQAPGFEHLPSSCGSSLSSPTSSSSPSSPSSLSSSLGLGSGSLALTHEPLLLSPISITTLPFYPSSSPSSSGSPSGSTGTPPGLTPPPPTSATLTPTVNPISRSRVPSDLDAQSQRAAHAERVRKPVVWGLFNQFVTGGSSTVTGSGSASVSTASASLTTSTGLSVRSRD